MKPVLSAVYFVFVFLQNIYCQEDRFSFRFINLPQNFKNQYISYVEKDASGLLWFVTSNGLHRYDGNQLLTFDINSQPSLHDISITSLFADTRNNLWVITKQYVVRFKLKEWTTEIVPFPDEGSQQPRDRMIESVGEGIDGRMYFGSAGGKLYEADDNRLVIIAKILPPNTGVSQYSSITTIHERVAGQLWLTTGTGQIVKVEKKNRLWQPPKYFELPELQDKTTTQVYFEPNGKCLFYTDGAGLYTFNTITSTFKKLKQPENLPSIEKIGVYVSGFGQGEAAIFINRSPENGGSSFAVYDFTKDSIKNMAAVYPQAFQNISFKSPLRTDKNTILVSASPGPVEISKIFSPFKTFLSNVNDINSIRTLYKTPGGPLYVASYTEGFVCMDENKNSKKAIKNTNVYTALSWNADSLLIGDEGNGLNWYIEKKKEFHKIVFDDGGNTDNKIGNYITCLKREDDSLIWVGTYSGIYLVNVYARSSTCLSLGNGGKKLRQSKIYDILITGNKRFFATQEGIFVFDTATKKIKTILENDKRYSLLRYSALLLANGQIWAGSEGRGIIVFDTTGLIKRRLTTLQGLAGNNVYITRRIKDYILAGTGQGLSIINLGSGQIRNYSGLEHLPADEFNHSASFINGDTAYLGTINGLISFNIDELVKYQLQSNPIHVFFTGLTTGSQKTGIQSDYTVAYRAHPSLTITPDINYFSIRFGGLDDITGKLKVYYRLKNILPWQEIGQQREITFAGIAPGRYDVELAGLLPDGRWFDNLVSIPLTVKPAFYQTLWFVLLLGLALASVIWLFFKFREEQMLKEHRLRAKIAGDLHDEVGSSLTRIYFQADVLSASPQTNSAAENEKNALMKIAASSKEALSSMSDMVWSIDSRFDTISDLVYRMKDYISRIKEDLGITCTLSVEGKYEKESLSQMIRQNLFLIFKEALTNAAKYSGREMIKVELQFKDQIILNIRNHFKESISRVKIYQGGNGLTNMKTRAAKMNAKIEINKEEGEFCIRLSIPY